MTAAALHTQSKSGILPAEHKKVLTQPMLRSEYCTGYWLAGVLRQPGKTRKENSMKKLFEAGLAVVTARAAAERTWLVRRRVNRAPLE